MKSVVIEGPGAVRIKVAACGVCHSDSFIQEGHWVGIGWHGDHCGVCDPCRRGDFVYCVRLQITGFSFDGGYQQYMIAPVHGLARIPEALSFAEAGPLVCAGVTTFNSLRHSRAMPGDIVAIHGIGGLGLLGVRFARHFGFHVIAISRGKDKEELALKLGAHRYLDSETLDAAKELARLGGAKVILATAPNSQAISELANGLAIDGMLLTIAGTMEPMAISRGQLIGGRQSVQGWASGSSKDSEDTLNFCALTGIRPMIEEFALEDAAKGYERMMTNRARFRAVLVSR
jgi:D-arabinose 1-dehydrogenase-like Zn-dependent alcohol dehydrogenase